MNEYVCYEGTDLNNYKKLDNIFLGFLEGLDYESYHIPGMISEDCLKKSGYIDSFPQQLTIPAYVDKEDIERVLESRDINNKNVQIEKMYMSPSACLHFYPILENKNIDKKIMTTLTQVYRYEEAGFSMQSRLWEFTVREILFVGNKDYISEKLSYILEKAIAFAKKIDPDAYVREASDIFFPSRKNEMKKFIQKRNKLKQEIVIHIGGREVAVASFNHHNNHFSKPFNFDRDGSVMSGCVGFGMERWVSACNEHKIIL